MLRHAEHCKVKMYAFAFLDPRLVPRVKQTVQINDIAAGESYLNFANVVRLQLNRRLALEVFLYFRVVRDFF